MGNDVPNLEHNRELDDDEKAAMERWKENDEKIDDLVIMIIDDVKILKGQAENINYVNGLLYIYIYI